jgi:hypothetical protein
LDSKLQSYDISLNANSFYQRISSCGEVCPKDQNWVDAVKFCKTLGRDVRDGAPGTTHKETILSTMLPTDKTTMNNK